MAKFSTKSLSKLAAAFKTMPNDVVCFDVKQHETRAIRVCRVNGEVSVRAAGVLPALNLQADKESSKSRRLLSVPAALRGAYAGILYSGDDTLIKHLHVAGAKVSKDRITELLGLKGENDHRIGYQILKPGTRQNEASVLAVALPESIAGILPRLLPAGRPAPYAISASKVGLLNVLMTKAPHADGMGAFLFVDVEESLMVFFINDELRLMRSIDYGSNALLSRIQRNLGVDPEIASSMLREQAIDLSGTINEIVAPIIRQFALSRDFVERHESASLQNVMICGDSIMTPALNEALRKSMHIEPLLWNPCEQMPFADSAIKPPPAEGWIYAAALGYALAIMENDR